MVVFQFTALPDAVHLRTSLKFDSPVCDVHVVARLFRVGVPELSDILGLSALEELQEADPEDGSSVAGAIRHAFSTLMRCGASVVSNKVSELVERLSAAAERSDAAPDQCQSITNISHSYYLLFSVVLIN